MVHSLQELTPPLPKEGMLHWWHEVRKREKGKNSVVVYMAFVLVYSRGMDIESCWDQQVVEGAICIVGGTNPITNAHVVKNCGEANLNYIATFWQQYA
jgi:hypothetical protein